jgi:hypothetical protein
MSSQKELFEIIYENLFSLKQTLQSFFVTLTPFLKESHTDENILLYLLEQKNKFNQYLGDRAIEYLLYDFFPKGKTHFHAVICEGFTRRGFADFLYTKEHLIEELEWPSPFSMFEASNPLPISNT